MRRRWLLTAPALLAACAPNGVDFAGSRTTVTSAPPTTAATTTDPPTTDPPATTGPPTTGPRDSSPPTSVGTLPPIRHGEPDPGDEPDLADIVDLGDDGPVGPHDELLAATIVDLGAWWSTEFPAVYGAEYVDVETVFAGYPERTDPIPDCGDLDIAYRDVADNAFYCSIDDYVVYDAGARSWFADLSEQHGPAVLPVIMAHEWGHVVQDRAGVLDQALPTIYTEQQADCFAGAWVGRAYRGGSDLVSFTDDDLRTSLLALLQVRDAPGLDQLADHGHGAAFDRVGAFQAGFLDGTVRCTELIDDPLPLVPNVFRPGSRDEALAGNAPYDCSELPDELRADCSPAPEFLAEDLDHYWATELGGFAALEWEPVDSIDTVECAGRFAVAALITLCPAERRVTYDEPSLVELYREVGDFTLGYLYGVAWAEMSLIDRGSGLAGEQRALMRDCLTGVWVADITPADDGSTPRAGDHDGDGESDTVASSPGDLDEAIQMAIRLGDDTADENRVGSAFEKIDALRTGVLTESCTDYE